MAKLLFFSKRIRIQRTSTGSISVKMDIQQKKAPDLEVRGSHEKNGKIAFGQ
jgi:hypothetical protein